MSNENTASKGVGSTGGSACCEKWKEHTTYKPFGADIDQQKDGTWSVSGCCQCYVLDGLRFCPWCGASVSPNHVLGDSHENLQEPAKIP